MAGTILGDLRDRAERFGLTFGLDPTTHTDCTLGGMIGNSSCGVHAVMADRTSDNVERELGIVTYGGALFKVGATTEEELDAIIRKGGRRGDLCVARRVARRVCEPDLRALFEDSRRVSGYNLDVLLPERGFTSRALCCTEF